MSHHLLTLLTFTPLVGALAVLALPSASRGAARGLGLFFSLVSLALVGSVWRGFDAGVAGLQFVERHAWIPSVGGEYFVGVDGLGLLMIFLTSLIVPFALLSSWKLETKPRLFIVLMLALQTGLFGAFTALNFVHWFVFWELSLVPAFFLIKLWGGPGRSAAALQFFIYTMVGSIAMLLGFMAVYLATGTFDFVALAEKVRGVDGGLMPFLSVRLYEQGWAGLTEESLALVIFLLVFLGFAVKVPLFPFHTWLPATYAEAPTSVSMVLTGVMSKMGVYGFVRILLPIFGPQMQAVQTPLLWLAVATIVFSACAAFAQTDLKRMIAYSSINHLGYCLLGVFAVVTLAGEGVDGAREKAAALNGVLLQMFNHGVTAAALFCFIGFLEQRSGGLRGVGDFGGLRQVAPVFCGLMGIALFASLGLPGLNGFIGEFLIFKGVFPLASWAAGLSVLGLLVTAVFLLTILQRVFNGPLADRWQGFGDLTRGERWLVGPAMALMLVIGIYPQWLMQYLNPTVVGMVEKLNF